MTADQSIKEFQLRVAEKLVHNAVTGDFGPVSEQVAASIISNVKSAFRHAGGTSDLTKIDYRTYADALPDWASADAEEHGLTDASNRSARCRRFVRTVDQCEYKQRHCVDVPLPSGWEFLGEALATSQDQDPGAEYRYSNLVRLAVTLGPRNIRAPKDLPTTGELKQLLQDELSVHPSAVRRMLRSYRWARELAIGAGVESERAPDIDRGPAEHERGLRSLPDLDDRLAAHGHPFGSTGLGIADIISRLAPRWYAAMAAFLAAHSQHSANWKKDVVGASSRMLAELARTGSGDLGRAHPSRLLVERVDTGEVVQKEVPGGEEWSEDFYDTLPPTGGREGGEAQAPTTRTALLLEHLAYAAAQASAENSTLRPSGESLGLYWTNTIQNDVRLVGELGLFAGKDARIFQAQPQLKATAEAEFTAFRRMMKEDNKKKSMIGQKPKEALLELGTYPVLLFLGLPALRKRALLRREEYHGALIRNAERPNCRSVLDAENAYHQALLDYILFAVFLADGLRLANYSHARLGQAERHAGKVCRKAGCGELVESFTHIKPILDTAGERLLNVQTCFFGDDHGAVKLKMAKMADGNWRSRPHFLRPGLVDYDLLLDYLTIARPRNLARQGLIDSPAAYDLRTDIEEWHFSLFVSPLRSTNPYRAVTGAYSPGHVSYRFGRILHWIFTVVLGRELAPYDSPELRKEYPRLFGPHGGRLEAGTYLFGILNRPEQAMAFLNDTLETVKKRYSVVEASMVHKRGWEAPHYFDALFSRVWDDNETIDWDREDPLADVPADQRPPGLEAVE